MREAKYAYDSFGRMRSMVYPDGKSSQFVVGALIGTASYVTYGDTTTTIMTKTVETYQGKKEGVL